MQYWVVTLWQYLENLPMHESHGQLVKRFLNPAGDPDAAGLGGDLRLSIPNRLPGDSDAVCRPARLCATSFSSTAESILQCKCTRIKSFENSSCVQPNFLSK